MSTSSTKTEDQTDAAATHVIDWDAVGRHAAEICHRFWPGGRRLDDRSRELLLSVVILASGPLSAEWLAGAVEITARVPRRNVVGYLRSVLVNRLIEYEARAEELGEAKAVMGQLLASVRGDVQAFLRRSRIAERDTPPPSAAACRAKAGEAERSAEPAANGAGPQPESLTAAYKRTLAERSHD